jgi:hypothetical protein
MSSRDALAVIQAAVGLNRTHPHAPALDVLDLVMRGRAGQVLDFDDPAAPNGSLAAASAPFGQLLAAAFDDVMTPTEWMALTSHGTVCPERVDDIKPRQVQGLPLCEADASTR